MIQLKVVMLQLWKKKQRRKRRMRPRRTLRKIPGEGSTSPIHLRLLLLHAAVMNVDENTESERECETSQEPTNKSKRTKKITHSSPASSTSVEAPVPDAMQESCEKCLLTSKWCFPHLEP